MLECLSTETIKQSGGKRREVEKQRQMLSPALPHASKPIHFLCSCSVVFLLLGDSQHYSVYFFHFFYNFFLPNIFYPIFHSINFVFFSRARIPTRLSYNISICVQCTFYLSVCGRYYDEFMITLDARVLIIIFISIFRRFLLAAFGAIACVCVHFLVTACDVTYTAKLFFSVRPV